MGKKKNGTPGLRQPPPVEPTYSATDPAYAAIRARVEKLKKAKADRGR